MDRAPCGGVSQCVVEQVGDGFGDPVRVHPYDSCPVSDPQVQLHPCCDVAGSGRGDRVGREPAQLDRFGVQVQLTLLGPRDGRHVGHQMAKAIGLVDQGRPRDRIQWQDTVDHGLHRGLQRRDRGAHLVGQVSDQAPANGLGVCQPGRHGVERVGELGELRADGRGLDAHAQVAPGDAIGRVGHNGDRAPQTPGHDPRHGERGDHRHRYGHAQRGEDRVGERVLHLHQQGRVDGSAHRHPQVVPERGGRDPQGDTEHGHSAGEHHESEGDHQPPHEPQRGAAPAPTTRSHRYPPGRPTGPTFTPGAAASRTAASDVIRRPSGNRLPAPCGCSAGRPGRRRACAARAPGGCPRSSRRRTMRVPTPAGQAGCG